MGGKRKIDPVTSKCIKNPSGTNRKKRPTKSGSLVANGRRGARCPQRGPGPGAWAPGRSRPGPTAKHPAACLIRYVALWKSPGRPEVSASHATPLSAPSYISSLHMPDRHAHADVAFRFRAQCTDGRPRPGRAPQPRRGQGTAWFSVNG